MIPPELQSELTDRPGGVFYLHGDDEYRKEAAARELTAFHLDPSTRDFNYDLLRGSDLDVETLASILGTPPMMADWRVIWIRETQALASSPRTRELILKVAEAPPPGLALILLCTEPERTKAKFYEVLKGSARTLEFRTPGSNDLPGWLIGICNERFGRELHEEAARALAQAVGADVGVLMKEVEKLATLVAEGEAITLETVEAAGTRIPRQDRWQWFDLVAEGEFRRALQGLPVLLDHGESGVGLTIGLSTHLLRVAVALTGGRAAIESVLPGRQKWLSKRYLQQARHWTLETVDDALGGLLRVDELLKSSAVSELHLLETWLLERLVVAEAA